MFKGDLTSLAKTGWPFFVGEQLVASILEVDRIGSSTKITLALMQPEYKQLFLVNGWRITSGTVPQIHSDYIDSDAEEI